MKIRFPFRCAKVLPLTFDDSLSYYEVLCKMRDTINAIIAAGETGLTPWGEIQGDIQDQTDLQTEFATKQDKLTVNPTGATATLTSLEIDGTKYNLGGQSTGATWGSITGTLSNQTDLQAALTALNALIAEKSEVDANPAAPATAHLVKLTIDGTTYDIQSELPIASATTLGGIKAANKSSSDTVEVKIGTDGKLYVPAAATGQSVAGVTVAGTSVVDTADNTAKIPAASSSTYGAIKVGDGLRVDGVSGATEVAIADTEDIDEERDNAIIDAGNVRYAAVEAMKDNTMSSADKTAIKTNLGTSVVSGVASGDNWGSITIDGTTKNIPTSGGSTYTAGDGISIANNVISCNSDIQRSLSIADRSIILTSDNTIKVGLKTSGSGLLVDNTVMPGGLGVDFTAVQPKLVAGTNITIDQATNTISATGGSSAPVWGNITGTLSNQTDLQTALNAKSSVTATDVDELLRLLVVDGTVHRLAVTTMGWHYTQDNVSYLRSIRYDLGPVQQEYYIPKISGTNDGTNWTSLTINDVTKNIPSGGSGTDVYVCTYLTTTYADALAAYNAGKILVCNTATGDEKVPLSRYDNVEETFHFIYLISNTVYDFRLRNNSTPWSTRSTDLQNQLTAGNNITIDSSTNTISATGTLPTNVSSRLAYNTTDEAIYIGPNAGGLEIGDDGDLHVARDLYVADEIVIANKDKIVDTNGTALGLVTSSEVMKRASALTAWNQDVLYGSATPAITLPALSSGSYAEIHFTFIANSTTASFTAPSGYILCDETGTAGLSAGNTLSLSGLTSGSIYECSFMPISTTVIRMLISETKTA